MLRRKSTRNQVAAMTDMERVWSDLKAVALKKGVAGLSLTATQAREIVERVCTRRCALRPPEEARACLAEELARMSGEALTQLNTPHVVRGTI